MTRYNVGFESVCGQKVGTIADGRTMDAAIVAARARIPLALLPGSASQACDNGPGDERFRTIFHMYDGVA
jgi:hypothetical protein